MTEERDERTEEELIAAMRDNEREIQERLSFTEESAVSLGEAFLKARFDYFQYHARTNELAQPTFERYGRITRGEGDVTLKDFIIREAENREMDPTWWASMTDADLGLGGRGTLPKKLREMAEFL